MVFGEVRALGSSLPMLTLHHHRRRAFAGKVTQLRPDAVLPCSSGKHHGYKRVYSAGAYLIVLSLATAKHYLGIITKAVQLQELSRGLPLSPLSNRTRNFIETRRGKLTSRNRRTEALWSMLRQ